MQQNPVLKYVNLPKPYAHVQYYVWSVQWDTLKFYCTEELSILIIHRVLLIFPSILIIHRVLLIFPTILYRVLLIFPTISLIL